MPEQDGLVNASDAIPLMSVHHQEVVDAAREYIEAIEAKVGKDISAWLANKTEKFVALKDALEKVPEEKTDGNLQL